MKNFNLRNLSYKTFLVIFGLFWICIHLYFRLLIDRPTQFNLTDTQSSTSLWIVLFSYFIILHILLLGVAIKSLFFGQKSNKILEHLGRMINSIYWEPLKYVENTIVPHIPGSGRFYMFLESKLQIYQHDTRFKKSMIFLFHFLPQIVLACIFSTELIFFKKLQLFFPGLFLLLSPIFCNIFLSIYRTFAERNINFINTFFEFINARDPITDRNGNPILNYDGTHAGYQTFEYILLEEHKGKVDPIDMIETRIRLIRILRFCDHLKYITSSFFPYCTLFSSSIYLLGGFYRLSYLFAKIFEMISTLPI